MGAVYLAVHPFLQRKAAIKILKPECASNAGYVQRFLNEARAANAIQHPNIIDIIDVGILPEGMPYMMMEFLQGESLADRLRRVDRMPIEQAVFVARQIASALAAAHAVSIIHRDLKPDNVFIVPDPPGQGGEHIKVLDFGIAKLRPDFAPTTPRTSAGALMGTPAYMSPEQCMGKNAEVDHRADIYALGVILFEMLCGRTPFLGENFGDYFLQHITVPAPSAQSLNPDIPAHLDALILKALAKEAKDRIQTMDVFADLLANKPVSATLVLDEVPGPPSHPAEPTVSLEEEPAPGLGKERRSHPRIRHKPTPSPRAPTPHTTMSSSAGQMRHVDGDLRAVHRRRKIAGIAIGAVTLCGAAALVGLAMWQRSTPSASSAERMPPDPLPAFAPSPLPTQAPPPPLPSLPPATPPPPVPPPPMASPVAEVEPQPARERSQAEKKRQARERTKTHASTRGEKRAVAPEGVTVPQDVLPPGLAPATTNTTPPPSKITREKF